MDTQGRIIPDRISTLPDDIIEKILTLMPIRDALRTSVLSKKWRYSWRSMPKLVFTEDMVTVPWSSCPVLMKSLLANAIFHVLLLHDGPTILKFCSRKLQMASEFDQIMSYLSRGNGVKELRFTISKSFYHLPGSFFSLQGLESIYLKNCVFEPPLTFNGFSRLKSMRFVNVKVSPQALQRFLPKCQRLQHIGLGRFHEDMHFLSRGKKFTFVDLLQCVPLIKGLDVSKDYVKCLSLGGMPRKLPTSLVHLEYLCLDVCLMDHNEMSSTLCIINSSPVLVKIMIWMYDTEKLPVQPTPVNSFDPENHLDLKLDHLEKFQVEGFSNLPLERKFVKLVMAKSPVLKKVQLNLIHCVSVDKEVKMHRNFVQQLASPSAQLIIGRPYAKFD